MCMQVQRKENELDHMKNVISSKEQEIVQMKLQGTVNKKFLHFQCDALNN